MLVPAFRVAVPPAFTLPVWVMEPAVAVRVVAPVAVLVPPWAMSPLSAVSETVPPVT